MKINRLVILSIFLLAFFAIPKAYSQSTQSNVKNPIDYFNRRTEAIGLAKIGKWQDAIPLIESLTSQYQNDGDLLYLLGLSYYQTEQYRKAITALKKTLDCGGTILSRIPSGSAPSNDIMIKIAKAYALDGDKENAMIWLRKGFAARYDEKPFLKDDPAFEAFRQDEDFQQLFGYASQTNLTREQAWAKDLDYLEKRISQLHYNLDAAMPGSDLTNSFIVLKSSINSLSDEQIVVELMKIFGGLGSGHNLIIPTSPTIGALNKLPVQFYQFNDGMFIVDAEEDFKQWIGYEVELIENTPIDEALQRTNAVNARDNDMQTLWLGPHYLALPDVLQGLGIIKNKQDVEITVLSAKGKSQKVIMERIAYNFTGLAKIPQLKNKEQPLYLSKITDPYWYELMPEENTIYVQFNLVTNKENQSFNDFNVELIEQIEKNKTQNLILDLRHNSGGDGSLLPPMLKALNSFELLNPNSKVFVIMGRATFSAAQNLLTEISTHTNAILVGEPSGSKPNHIGEAGWFKLPYSGLSGLISTQFHQTSKAEDHRKWIAPHIPVSLSSTDYFTGNDIAMNTIMEVIKAAESENKN